MRLIIRLKLPDQLQQNPADLSAHVPLNRPCFESEAKPMPNRYPLLYDEKVHLRLSKGAGRCRHGAKLVTVMGKLGPAGQARPVRVVFAARLRRPAQDHDPPLVIDGPFSRTKEQLLWFYIGDCVTLDAALSITKELAQVNPFGASSMSSPVGIFFPARPQS